MEVVTELLCSSKGTRRGASKSPEPPAISLQVKALGADWFRYSRALGIILAGPGLARSPVLTSDFDPLDASRPCLPQCRPDPCHIPIPDLVHTTYSLIFEHKSQR